MNNTMLITTISPDKLGMEKVIELVSAGHETFYYRGKHKRVIAHRVINEHRWRNIRGPLIYVVTDGSGTIRYVGKLEADTALHSRWLRHDTVHHQERTRNIYIEELEAGRGPLTVWSTSARELKPKLPGDAQRLHDVEIACKLESLWIQRWKNQFLWNKRMEPVSAGFSDGEYWR